MTASRLTTKQAIRENFLYFIFSSIVIAFQFLFYLLNSTFIDQMDLGGSLFYITASLSHATLFALIPYLLFMLAMVVTRNKLISNAIQISTMVLLNSFFFINSFVFTIYKFHINAFVIDMLFSEGSDEIFVFDAMLYLKVALFILGLIFLNLLLKYLSVKIYKRKGRCFFSASLILFIAVTLFSNFYHAYSNVVQKISVIRSAPHLPYYFPFTANRFMIKMGILEKDVYTRVNVNSGKGSDIQYPITPIRVDSSHIDKKNIILILIDSWNTKACNELVTPEITKFKAKSSVFTHHLSSANGTQGAVFGLFFGLPATYYKDFNILGIQPIMIEQMKKEGYQINAFSSASMVTPPFIKMLFDNDPGIRSSTEGKTVYDRDLRITTDYINYLDTVPKEKPFFSLLFYDLAHGLTLPKNELRRFKPSWEYADYTKLNNKTDPTEFYNLYRNSVAVIDSFIGMVIDKLEQDSLLKNSIVMITGDHGQEFNENKMNYWGHKSNFSPIQMHVPFIFYSPDEKPAVYNHRTTHYDIPPTLMHNYLGVVNPISDYGRGYVLTDTTSRNWHYAGDNLEYAFIIENDHIIKLSPTGRYEITDCHLKELKDYPISPKQMSEALHGVNKFYK